MRIVAFIIFFISINSWARSPIPCQGVKPTEILDKDRAIEIIAQHELYQAVKNVGEPDAKILPNGCYNKSGTVEITNYSFNLMDKKCLISNLQVRFKIEKELAVFDEVSFKGQKMSFNKFVLEHILSSLEKIVKDTKTLKAFQEAAICNIEYFAEPSDNRWMIKLKSQKGTWCFLRGKADGSEAGVIARMYAQNSSCF